MEKLEKISKGLNQGFNWVAGAGLVIMLVLTVADVIAIKVFSSPIPGTIELVSFLSVVVIAFALAYTQQLKGHIQVDFFVTRLPHIIRDFFGALVSAIGIVLFALLAWRSFEYAQVLQLTGEVSMTQRIPFYPFVYAIAVCCIPVCLQLLIELINYISRMVKR
ncbi:MAG: TRAP transporter small permease [Dehalococcoidales bacterium]|jgi:TRAP-type C4-dicarboxylate transport system permease small subunit|nr:TRAP transporter small permease [Dehalococcoidales bacterium]MDD5605394.1 TRAP transporter small permease [Dehalococcoidales bacterium]MDX9986394.1 TRAP transporter small permease [Dehalococcoidales bacterium]NLE89701.1 TRAP transporter small permease [Dehalococcoidales bacterium]